MRLYCSHILSMLLWSLSISASVPLKDSKKLVSMGYSRKLNKERISEWKAWYIRYDYLESLFDDEKMFIYAFKHELTKIEEFFIYAEKEIINAKRLVICEPERKAKRYFSEPDGVHENSSTHTSGKYYMQNAATDTNQDSFIPSSSSSSEYNSSSTEIMVNTAEHTHPYRVLAKGGGSAPKAGPVVAPDVPHDRCARMRTKAGTPREEYLPDAEDVIIEIDDINYGDLASEGDIHRHSTEKERRRRGWKGIVAAQKTRIFKDNIFSKRYDKNMSERALLDYIADLKQIIKYRNLNLLGFKKILYKYDKAKGRNITHILMPLVERSYFNVSRDIDSVAKEASLTYQMKYYKNNPEKARTILRRISRKERSSQLAIFLTGVVLALSIVFHFYIFENIAEDAAGYYVSVLAVQLGAFLFGGCLFVFKTYSVNYNYIFNFNHGSKLDNGTFLLLTSAMILVHQASVFYMHSKYGSYIVFILILIVVFPMDVLYRLSRYSLLGSLLKSFVLGIELFLESNGVHQGSCLYAVMVWPGLIRTLQCARRYFDESLMVHVYNGAKYIISMLSIILGHYQLGWRYRQYICTTVCMLSSSYSLYWDLFIDWNILRPRRLFPTSAYAAIIAINMFLRFLWAYKTYLGLTKHACLLAEVLRRFLWLLVRVEHEHLNNCNQLKAMKYVRLPFQEMFYRKNYEPLETDTRDETEENSVDVLAMQALMDKKLSHYLKNANFRKKKRRCVDSAVPDMCSDNLNVLMVQDGRIVLDETSLYTDTRSPSVCEVSDDSNTIVTSATFKKARGKTHWTEDDNKLFYEALVICGLEFTLISELFPHKTRKQIKRKFLKEERTNRAKIDAILGRATTFDSDAYQKLKDVYR
ncbi:UNVERIFIED_CONTAM: hypothetical protein PYX00_011603 [Menopon gallinae]|uniref:Uncharacterized protein n=1 Tax=Menopon gallinae TaxID=328185 RepID=A0AAW2H855_9NEOP